MILEITDGNWVGATFRLGRRTLTIGRDARNVIQIADDPEVSRRHAMIRWDGVRHIVTDLHSRNGMTLNGNETTQGEITVGDVLQIGGTTFEVTSGLRVVNDASLAPKVGGGKAARATASANQTMRLNVDAAIKKGELVEVDDFHAAQELLVKRLVFGIGRNLAKGLEPMVVIDKASEGLRDLLEPDRLLVLRLTDEQRVKLICRKFADSLEESQQKVRPWMEGLSAAAGRRKPYIANALPDKAAPLGSMAAVPIMGGERALGVLYMDSFAQGRQSFIDEDATILAEVADALKPVFEKL